MEALHTKLLNTSQSPLYLYQLYGLYLNWFFTLKSVFWCLVFLQTKNILKFSILAVSSPLVNIWFRKVFHDFHSKIMCGEKKVHLFSLFISTQPASPKLAVDLMRTFDCLVLVI